MDTCQICEDSGIVGIAQDKVPITCCCVIGTNALNANPTWHQLLLAEPI